MKLSNADLVSSDGLYPLSAECSKVAPRAIPGDMSPSSTLLTLRTSDHVLHSRHHPDSVNRSL